MAYLTEDELRAEFVRQMPDTEKEAYGNFGHLRVESIFRDRVFVVFKSHGRDHLPEILTTVRVKEVAANNAGASALLIDQSTGLEMAIGYMPVRLFDYPIFISLPLHMRIQYQSRLTDTGHDSNLAFAMLVKTRNRVDFLSPGNVYVESPNSFRELYPNVVGLHF